MNELLRNYPSSGLRKKDFIVGETVIVTDPRGDKLAYLSGYFNLFDECVVNRIGDSCLYVTVKRNQYQLHMYHDRFSKPLGNLRVGDEVLFENKQTKILKYTTEGYKIAGFEGYFKSSQLKLVSRKKLLW